MSWAGAVGITLARLSSGLQSPSAVLLPRRAIGSHGVNMRAAVSLTPSVTRPRTTGRTDQRRRAHQPKHRGPLYWSLSVSPGYLILGVLALGLIFVYCRFTIDD